MKVHRNRSVLVFMAVLGGLLLVTAPAASAGSRTREMEIPAAGVESVVLDGGNGSVEIDVGDDEQIRIRVEVSPGQWIDTKPFSAIRNWFLSSSYDDIDDLLEATEIRTERSGAGKLRVALSPADSVREGRVEEKWIVTLPARLAVSLRMSSAEMQIDGVAGGTEVRAGHGSVRVDVPRGDLRIDLTVGDVKVHNASTSLGNVVLNSRVGSTRLWINGLRLQVPNPPGPGSRISAAGEGQETIRVGVEVGDISVKAGVADSSP